MTVEISLCVFCDDAADQSHPGAPLCSACWDRVECKSREPKPPIIVELPAGPAGLQQRHHARLIASGQHELAGFVGLAALGGPPNGTTVQ